MRSQGKTTQAKSDLSSLKIDEAKLKDSIALQVRDALNACREAEEIVKALSGTVRQAEKLLSMAEKGYEYGVRPSSTWTMPSSASSRPKGTWPGPGGITPWPG